MGLRIRWRGGVPTQPVSQRPDGLRTQSGLQDLRVHRRTQGHGVGQACPATDSGWRTRSIAGRTFSRYRLHQSSIQGELIMRNTKTWLGALAAVGTVPAMAVAGDISPWTP